jgi:hypothetical protein
MKFPVPLVLCVLLTALLPLHAGAKDRPADVLSPISAFRADPLRAPARRGARLETLWIFDADFEDLDGDNAGWTALDVSGVVGSENVWHKDTIRTGYYPPAGDSTWWCGMVNPCWIQPRGYGNNWVMILERAFPEVAANSDPGDDLYLNFDQRFAMEHDYDYGYIDVSANGGSMWTTVHTVNNPGFAGKPGFSKDWTDATYGHVELNLAAFAGENITLRFRFESDEEYSSQDQYNNPPDNTCLDGAWQIDNITWSASAPPDPPVTFWADDCESPGDNGWNHDDVEPSNQTGVTFWRGQFGYDFFTGYDFTCDDRPEGSWMYAPVDPFYSTLIDNEYALLMSPPIDVAGAAKLVGQWDFWVDIPLATGDLFNLYLASSDVEHCVSELDGFYDEEYGWWFADAAWYTRVDNWDAFSGNDWLGILWAVRSDPSAGNGEHFAGMLMNRQRVGVPSGDPGTIWERSLWENFNDWFWEDLGEAILDTTRILIRDDDGVVSARVLGSNDDGATWDSYDCRRQDSGNPADHWWLAPPPWRQMSRGSEIRYYFEAVDGAGNVSTFPDAAPDVTDEMSILPLEATTDAPGILLVDKHGRATPGALRHPDELIEGQEDLGFATEVYYREALEILGYDYEMYDVEVPSGSRNSDGPDTTGMKYYHTQIWFTGQYNAFTLNPLDQYHLIQWLGESAEGKERNLLLSGNDIGYELEEAGRETLAFYETWLASDYVENAVGVVIVDSVPGLEDHAGDSAFLTHGDGECILRGACPTLNYFDVVRPKSSVVGAETVADYIRHDGTRRQAGVAYTHATMGYQTVNLGFGIEFMMDGVVDAGPGNYTPEGYYHSGLLDRLDLVENIMEYFAIAPGIGTGAEENPRTLLLAQARPNPFHPGTSIAYRIGDAGRVTIDVYSVAGKAVRTLLDDELPENTAGEVVWDGRDGAGVSCASGVYFYRIAAPGFAAKRKMVLLK